ncbi:MAG TPA: response regulator transcription factor [Ktedonobacterales bacterium]
MSMSESNRGTDSALTEAHASSPEDESGGLITIVIADDHALVREGTRRLLEAESGLVVLGEAGDGATAIAEVERVRPSVVIMDIAMPGMNGIEATRQIKARQPQVAVLALTAHDDDQYILKLLDAGAAGFLLKDAGGRELANAVRSVHRGETILSPAIAARAARLASERRAQTESRPPLSEREMEVLREAARGLPNKDIARRLSLSVRTVHTHLGNIFSKLGVGSRTEAVLLALRSGWISLEDTYRDDPSPTDGAGTTATTSRG